MTVDFSVSVLVVTGLRREARCLAGAGVTIVRSGGLPARLRATLQDFPAGRLRAVVSYGICGGLDPALAPGDIVLSRRIVAAGRSWTADAGIVRSWAGAISERAHIADIAGVDRVLCQPADKAALRTETGAAAADMESHIAAAFAAERDIPFVAMRTVCDPAGRRLPDLVEHAVDPDGGLDLRGIVRSIVRHPAQLHLLPVTARDASAALASLRRCGAVLGPGLGLADLGEPLGDLP